MAVPRELGAIGATRSSWAHSIWRLLGSVVVPAVPEKNEYHQWSLLRCLVHLLKTSEMAMTNIPTTKEKASAGDSIPPKCSVIEVHVGELKQLFDAIDPSPFRDRDLDPKAEEFIVGWAKDLPKDTTLALLVDLDREAGLPDEAAVLRRFTSSSGIGRRHIDNVCENCSVWGGPAW